jgi:hypothetical protein
MRFHLGYQRYTLARDRVSIDARQHLHRVPRSRGQAAKRTGQRRKPAGRRKLGEGAASPARTCGAIPCANQALRRHDGPVRALRQPLGPVPCCKLRIFGHACSRRPQVSIRARLTSAVPEQTPITRYLRTRTELILTYIRFFDKFFSLLIGACCFQLVILFSATCRGEDNADGASPEHVRRRNSHGRVGLCCIG